MFTVKISNADQDVIIGNVREVIRRHIGTQDTGPGIILIFDDENGSAAHHSAGHFYVMNEQGATVATYHIRPE